MNLIKKSSLFLTLLLLVFHFDARSQSFEGTISVHTFTKEDEENADIKWYVKDGNHKLEIAGYTAEHSYKYEILLRTGDPNLKMISEQGGETLVFDIPPKQEVTSQESGELVTTQETKTIAGHTCRKIKLIKHNSITTCWISDAILLPSEKFPGWLKSNPVYHALAKHQVKGFPMEIATVSPEGELLYSLTVKAVNQATLNAAEFELPESYTDGEKAIKKSFQPE